MNKFFISIVLAFVALLLFITIAPFGILYGVGTSFVRVKIGEGFQKIAGYFMSIAISINQTQGIL